jgi:hypothetical protein
MYKYKKTHTQNTKEYIRTSVIEWRFAPLSNSNAATSVCP